MRERGRVNFADAAVRVRETISVRPLPAAIFSPRFLAGTSATAARRRSTEEERWKGESCEASVSSGVEPPLNFLEKFCRVGRGVIDRSVSIQRRRD